MDKYHVIAIIAAIIYQNSHDRPMDNVVDTAYDLYDRVITASPEVRRVREATRKGL